MRAEGGKKWIGAGSRKIRSPLLVWEIRRGDHPGTYVVGRVGQHWAYFDEPVLPYKADLEADEKAVAPCV
jgi:hypothetical protein